MKKLLLSALVAGSMVAGAGVALADRPSDPGKEHGHCTAFFNGQKNGHGEDGEYPGPFQPLLDNAPDGSDENDTGGDVADLFDACEGNIGGNPDENGRFTTCWTDDDGDAGTHPCDD